MLISSPILRGEREVPRDYVVRAYVYEGRVRLVMCADRVLIKDALARVALSTSNALDRKLLARWQADEDAQVYWDKVQDLLKKRGIDHFSATDNLIKLVIGFSRTIERANVIFNALDKSHDCFVQRARNAEELATFFRRLTRKGVRVGEWKITAEMARQRAEEYRRDAHMLRNMANERANTLKLIRPTLEAFAMHEHKVERQPRAFMCLIGSSLEERCGRPLHDVVAHLANVVFPGQSFSAEQVRWARGGRKKSGCE